MRFCFSVDWWTKKIHAMGESKIIIEETEKSSSKSPLPPFVKGGGISSGHYAFPPFTKKGGYGGIFWRVLLPFLGLRVWPLARCR